MMLFATVLAACVGHAPPPNVVIVFTDDQGYGDLSCYGHPAIKTPNIDRLAAEGMRLSDFHVAANVCSPSRAALLTGCYPKRVGMHKHVLFPRSDYGLHPDEVTIAEVLSEAGYATGCVGKWHLGHRAGLLPTDQGFDSFFGLPYSNDMSQFHRPDGNTYPHSLPLMSGTEIIEWEPDQRQLTQRLTAAAVSFIDDNAKEPFFLYLPHSMPHIPIYASQGFAGKSKHGTFGDVIEELDWSVGEIRASLQRNGVAENTLIIFASDNGPRLGSAGPLRGKKGTIYEGGSRVPCVWWWPGHVPAGVTCDVPVTAMDVLPTVASLTNAPLANERTIDGEDVSAVILGKSNEPLNDEFLYYTSRGALAGLRQGDWKFLLEQGTLVNLQTDLGEQNDVAAAHPERVQSMRSRAHELDEAIEADARPVLKVEEWLWDPATRVRPEVTVLCETEAFDDFGGWVLDSQFMDLMGSPFLLAHGMGVPVADASTSVSLPRAGEYRVWVRTRDWVAPWNARPAPGRFQVLLDDVALATTFGTEGDPWHWQDGGTVSTGRTAKISLHDLTGFEGRVDAIVFASNLDFVPPNDAEALEAFRRAAFGGSGDPVDGGAFDLVVVGGGMAGTSAAVAAARSGLSVALVQDRPVLGGNSSSEVRVWPQGHVNQRPHPRVGDVVMELVPKQRSDSANAQGAAVFDDARKTRVVRDEENITLFLETRMNGVEMDESSIASILCENVRSGERTRLKGQFFLDSTGDASLGYLAGADFKQTDRGHMGASNLWNIQCLCEDEEPLSSDLVSACEEATFPRCPWAVDLRDKPFPGRTTGSTEPEAGVKPISLGNWFWENGFDRDPINEMERIRDQNFRAMYGAWDAIKNVEKRYPAHRLNWVAYVAGKRESRRLMGDVVLTGKDLREGTIFEDGCFPCTWGIDTHHPNTKYAAGHEGDEFIASATQGEGYVYDGPYWVPYRCLYSRNIENLFMAGRDISVTHEALGAVRVMKTTGAMGEIVGMAAAICKSNDCGPREVYSIHLEELKSLMAVGVGRVKLQAAGEDGSIKLHANAAMLRGRQLRYEPGQDSLGYWRDQRDFAEWAFEVSSPGRYKVYLEYACDPADAGGAFEVRLAGQPVFAALDVEPTDSWKDYDTLVLGTFEATAGTHRISVHSMKPTGPLMKLRSVRLVR